MKLKQINKIIKGIFVPLKRTYYFGKLAHGTPYFWPMNFCNSILKVRKLKLSTQEVLDKCPNDWCRAAKKFSNIPMVRRSYNWKINLFNQYWYLEIGWPIMTHMSDLGWKDKFETPRFEWSPAFQIFFFRWQFCIFWNAPNQNDDTYWEMMLWYHCYCNDDIVKAEESWGWTDHKTKKSTWNDDYVIKNK